MSTQYLHYRVTSQMGSIEVFLHPNVIEDCRGDPRKLFTEVAHQAWRALWESPAKKMLKSLCDTQGAGSVKARFIKSISIEEI